MSISCRQLYTTISRQICQGQFIQRFLREALIKSARAESERFFSSRRLQKWRNTVCISHFLSRADREKDPLSSRRRFIQRFLRFTDCHTSAAALVRNDMQFTVVLRCSKTKKQPCHIIQKKTQKYPRLSRLGYFLFGAASQIRTGYPVSTKPGFRGSLRPRIQILSAYADRADEAASFRMEDIKNDQGQRASVIFWSC